MPQTGKPIVIAHHIMWTLYGWWLPNDIRGSTSREIRFDPLRELSALHFGRKTVQPTGAELREFRDAAADVLSFPLLAFDTAQTQAAADAIGSAIAACNYTCYACAVMPDHVHLLIRKHKDAAEEMIGNIQTLSRERLIAKGVRAHYHPVWTNGGWKVFLDHPDEVWRTIKYINDNPRNNGCQRRFGRLLNNTTIGRCTPATRKTRPTFELCVPPDDTPSRSRLSVRSAALTSLPAPSSPTP